MAECSGTLAHFAGLKGDPTFTQDKCVYECSKDGFNFAVVQVRKPQHSQYSLQLRLAVIVSIVYVCGCVDQGRDLVERVRLGDRGFKSNNQNL